MKKILKAMFGERQWENLAMIKMRIFSFLNFLTISLIKKLPDKILLGIRSTPELRRKMDYDRHDIYLNISSEIEYDIRLHSCEKEPEIIEWIENFFKEDEIFYDVGANVGAYSLVAAKYLNGKITVYAFEPGFMTFVQLCKNIFINNCHEIIIPIQIALSDKTSIDIFNYNNLMPGGVLHTLGNPIDYNKGDIFMPVLKQPILSYRMDDFIRQFNMPIPNHIKIDVDGIEFKILKGAEELLQNPLVKSVFVELEEGSDEANKIIDCLEYKGFKFYSKHKDVYRKPKGWLTKMHNYIFHKEIK